MLEIVWLILICAKCMMIWYYPMIVVVKIMLDILAVYVGYTSFFLESSLQGALLCWLHIFFPESLQGA